MMSSMAPGPPPGSGQQPGLQHSQTDVDPVTKFKMLIPHLKESLQVCNRLFD